MNILAVDDEYYALILLQKAISEVVSGATLYVTQNVSTALQTAKAEKIDVAFLDIHMPEMTGIQLAYELKKTNPNINIIFVTGFDDHMKDGIKLRMSGYVFKPVTSEAIKIEMENLRNPIDPHSEKRIRIKTFGNFDVFVDNVPLKFERKQSKEILAYLVDKRGTSVTYPELASVIWENGDYDRVQQKNLQVYIASLVKTLNSVNVKDLILKSRQGILINMAIVDCDYYRFLDGDTRAINSFMGQYMSAYSWAEFTAGYLENKLSKM